MNCEWNVECPANRTIIVKMIDMQVEHHHAYLAIHNRPTMTVIANYSGNYLPPDLITRTNRLIIRFRSDQSSGAAVHRGFSLSLSSVTMGTTIEPMIITAANAVIRTLRNNSLSNTYTSVAEYRIIEYDHNREKPILWDPIGHKLVHEFPSERGVLINTRTECLTYDPIHGLFFWIDIQYNTINAMNITRPSMIATLLELESYHSMTFAR